MTNEAARDDSARKNVLICDTQPVAIEGMKWLIESSDDLRFAGSVCSLEEAYRLLDPEAARIADELAAAEAALAEAALAEAALAEAALLQAALAEAALAEPVRSISEATAVETVEAVNFEVETSVTAPMPEPAVEPVAAVETTTALQTEAAFETVPVFETVPALETVATEDNSAAAMETAGLPEGSPIPESELAATPELTSAPESTPAPAPVPIDAIVIDKGLGIADVMELLHKLAASSHPTPAVVWGSAISEPEALRLLQAGARGILRRTSESATLLTCLRTVTSGGTWMEDGIFGSTEKLYNRRRSQLTHRESEVVVLVEKGLRNRDIARTLGIQTGTVKIHLKHIFEKTGVRGRYGLALTGLQNKGSITLSPPPQFMA